MKINKKDLGFILYNNRSKSVVGEFGATATSVSVDLEKEKEIKWKLYPNPTSDF